jgi:RNA polymerase sigma factor (sigma-70 family)
LAADTSGRMMGRFGGSLFCPTMPMQVTTGRDAEHATLDAGANVQQRAALDRVLERFGDVARHAGAAHGLRGDDLDEVMQDVRIRIWKAATGVGKLETLTSAYVYRAAVSAALDLMRRRRARREESIGDEVDGHALAAHPAANADARLASEETLAAIDHAVDGIPASRRAVVRMHLQGYDRAEIAALLGWSEAKTRNLLYRGLEDLRRRLIARGMTS